MYREGLEWTLFDSPVNLLEVTTPTVVEADTLKLYAKDKSGVSALYYMDDALVEHDFSAAGPLVSGTGVVNRLAYWTATDTIDDVPRTFTAGSVLFAGTDFLPQEDNANFFWDDTNNRLGVGINTPRTSLHIADNDASTANFRGITIDAYSGGAGTVPVARCLTRAARNTSSSPAAVQAGDTLLQLSAGAYNGSAFAEFKVGLDCVAGETWTTTANGTYISIHTTPLLSTTRAERFRIGESGQLGIGGATYGTAGNLFQSGGASAAPSWLDHTTDFLSQYALLAGRSGGQTIIGGTAVADFLSLQATAGIGAGSEYIKFLLGNNGATEIARLTPTGLGVNTALPRSTLHVNGIVTLPNNVYLRGTSAAGHPNYVDLIKAGTDDRVAVGASLVPAASLAQNFGNASARWLTVYTQGLDITGSITLGSGAFVGLDSESGMTVGNDTIINGASGVYININSNAVGGTGPFQIAKDRSTNSGGTLLAQVDYTSGILSIGTASVPSTGTFGIVLPDGTAFATMAANTAGLYAADIVAGNSAIHALSEAGDLIKLYKTGTYTPTNVSADRSYDANSTTIDELADVLGTLITDLQLTGLIG